jgi:hypothetical protein
MRRTADSFQNDTAPRAVLIRDIPVTLRDVSLSGCLLESRTRLQAPVAGQLRVIVNGEARVDDIRLSRCVFVEGSGVVYRAGAEFLWIELPGERSLRRAVRLFQDAGKRIHQQDGGKRIHQQVKSERTEIGSLAIDGQPESE